MKFLRRNSDRHSKLGRKRKKKQVWRSPKGRHNKMRDKRRGYPAVVNIGYRQKSSGRGKLDGMTPVSIMNVKDLDKIKTGEIGVIGNVGMKKRIDIIRKAEEIGTNIYNVNVKKFMKQNMKSERQANVKMPSASGAVLENKK